MHPENRLTCMTQNFFMRSKDAKINLLCRAFMYLFQSFIGISWFVMSLAISSINDVVVQSLSAKLSPLETLFYRFFFGTLILVPFIWYKGYCVIRTSRPKIHLVRGFFLAAAIFLWIKGIHSTEIITATIVSFTIPIFVLLFAVIFLKEAASLKFSFLSIAVLTAIVVIIHPEHVSINSGTFLLLISSLLFAGLDVINKRYISKETLLSMLFYSSVIVTVVAVFPMLIYWQTWKIPTIADLIYLIILGVGSNLILFCLLKAFRFVKLSSIGLFRYLELIAAITYATCSTAMV